MKLVDLWKMFQERETIGHTDILSMEEGIEHYSLKESENRSKDVILYRVFSLFILSVEERDQG